mmetsp:Transcript_12431/g.36109  ORF Transcript_12431/g.36109 Transcript_12431/m.36109 type:complete len:304 (-) Transcript_12431:1306-2217(-)
MGIQPAVRTALLCIPPATRRARQAAGPHRLCPASHLVHLTGRAGHLLCHHSGLSYQRIGFGCQPISRPLCFAGLHLQPRSRAGVVALASLLDLHAAVDARVDAVATQQVCLGCGRGRVRHSGHQLAVRRFAVRPLHAGRLPCQRHRVVGGLGAAVGRSCHCTGRACRLCLLWTVAGQSAQHSHVQHGHRGWRECGWPVGVVWGGVMALLRHQPAAQLPRLGAPGCSGCGRHGCEVLLTPEERERNDRCCSTIRQALHVCGAVAPVDLAGRHVPAAPQRGEISVRYLPTDQHRGCVWLRGHPQR